MSSRERPKCGGGTGVPIEGKKNNKFIKVMFFTSVKLANKTRGKKRTVNFNLKKNNKNKLSGKNLTEKILLLIGSKQRKLCSKAKSCCKKFLYDSFPLPLSVFFLKLVFFFFFAFYFLYKYS